MQLSARQALILERVRAQGQVDVEDLAGALAVTPQTIRRDLNQLAERGLIARIHGGAIPAPMIANFAYEARRVLAAEGKRWIGERAAGLIPDGCSLFINIGTTTEQVARALRNRRDLLVVTNNLNVVHLLMGVEGIQLIIAGGLVRQEDGGIVGEAAVEFIRRFKVDYAVIGTSAIDPDGALLDYDYREVSVARAILDNSRRQILVADASKYGRTAPGRIGDLREIDVFVTDRPPPEPIRMLCAEAGVGLHHPDAPAAA